jgi:transposase InsO family protein
VINHLRDDFGVEPVCRELDLSVSAYNAGRRRPASVRRLRDERLVEHIRRIHAASGETYGARRVHRQLRREDVHAARCTVERLMREDGLEGVIRGQRRRTTIPEPSAPRPPDLVNRHFEAHRPNQLWVADLTYIRTWPGSAYAAFVLDVYSRMIVGWQLATHMRTDLPLDALETA